MLGWVSLNLFLVLELNGSIIPKASAHFNEVHKSNPQSKKKSRIFAMAAVEFSLDNAESSLNNSGKSKVRVRG